MLAPAHEVLTQPSLSDQQTANIKHWQATLDAMPALKHSDCRVGFDDTGWFVHAPLSTHENDKACAFGGSLASIMTLAGWLHVNMLLTEHDLTADVYVQSSNVHYLLPVATDIVARAQTVGCAKAERFLRALNTHGKARMKVHVEVMNEQGEPGTQMEASYVAFRKAD